MESFKLSDKEETKKKQPFLFSIFQWKLSPEDLKIQIDNYNTLKIYNSSRGIATLILIFIMTLSLVMGMLSLIPIGDVVLSLLVYIPITIFIYLGHRWAIICGMILWTLEKIFQISNGSGYFISTLIWWVVLMGPLWGAYQVEQTRKRKIINK